MNNSTIKTREHALLLYLVIYFLIAIAILIIVSCKKSGPVSNIKSIRQLSFTKSQNSLVSSSNEFGFKLFQNLNLATPEDSNLFISPLSVSLALAMTYNGSDGATKTAFEQTMGLTGLTVDDINQSYQGISSSLTTVDSKVTMNIANSIWYSNTFDVQQGFLTTDQTYYDAKVSALDFTNPASVNTINNWVDEKTNHKIPAIIDNIPDNMVMYLINAIYFKGSWTYKFDPAKTAPANFSMTNGNIESVPFMVQKDTFLYFTNETFSSIQMPYGQGNLVMMIFLPNQEKTLNDIATQLSDVNLSSWIGQMSKKSVQLYLPKFKINYSTKLNQSLTDLGLGVAFDPDNANFSKINQNIPLYISEVKHKSFVEVNEEGTEAAAVTSVGISTTTAGPGNKVIWFNVNHPFLFAIREVSSNTIVFIGKVANIQ